MNLKDNYLTWFDEFFISWVILFRLLWFCVSVEVTKFSFCQGQLIGTQCLVDWLNICFRLQIPCSWCQFLASERASEFLLFVAWLFDGRVQDLCRCFCNHIFKGSSFVARLLSLSSLFKVDPVHAKRVARLAYYRTQKAARRPNCLAAAQQQNRSQRRYQWCAF